MKISIYKKGFTGRLFDVYTSDEFFKQEFVMKVSWNKIEFTRPTVDTKTKIRRASKNNKGFRFTIALDEDACGKYDIEQDEDKLIVQLV
jgi:hypothetical protein